MIVTLGLVSVILLQTMTIRHGTRADNLTMASLLAESEIERLRTYTGFNEIPSKVVAGPVLLTREGELCPADGTKQCYTRVTQVESQTPTRRSHTIRVTVSWPGGGLGDANSVSYEAIITDFNLGNSGV
jgi:Tfp pilus assembly protein PilV